MTEATHMEARLMGLSKKRSKDGDYFLLQLSVHPKDMPNELYGVELGTRMGIAMVQIAEDETETQVVQVERPKQKFEDMPPSQQAGIRCGDIEFQDWITGLSENRHRTFSEGDTGADVAAILVREHCGVDSRSLLNGQIASERWKALNIEYLLDTHMAEQR